MDPNKGNKIRRKPVSATAGPAGNVDQASVPSPRSPLSPLSPLSPATEEELWKQTSYLTLQDGKGKGVVEDPPPVPRRLESVPPLVASPEQISRASTSNFTGASSTFSGTTMSSSMTSPSTPITPSSSTKEKSFWKTALTETRHFAGGLISHPHESTRNYTILRHSSGLIMYRGPGTTVTISIFSSRDHPLPADRTIWLQQRGFSGDTGMKLKSLVGVTGSWLDVTPAWKATPKDVGEVDERGWQRDIKKFLKHAAREKRIANHVARETDVVRIPAAAQDGYFRLVLCTGGTATNGPAGSQPTKRKVLCTSPIFRVASTSTDSSVLRGSSLKTMPLEMGIKVASMVGNNAVMNVISPVTDTIQGQMEKYQPGFVATEAGTMAYSQTGLQGRVDAAGEAYDQRREAAYAGFDDIEEGAEVPVDAIGPDEGPVSPYPVKFYGKVVQGTGRGKTELGVPTADLSDVPEDIRLRMKGVYFGWACILPKEGIQDLSHDWHEALVSVGPSPYASPKVVAKNIVAVHFIHDFGDKTFFGARVKVVIMGFLRSMRMGVVSREETLETVNQDVLVTVTSLSREHWGPEMTLDKMKSDKSSRSFAEKYADTRGKVQKQVDRIPLHWAGVRTPGAELRDQAHGNGGLWIPR